MNGIFCHPLAGLLWERQLEKILLKYGWEKVSNWECLFVHREKGLFLSVKMDDIKLAGKKQNMNPMLKLFNKELDLGEPTSFLDHVYLGCTQRQCEISKDIVDNYRTMFESRISLARIGRPDILRSVNKLARSITKWTKACDKRLNRLISKNHHTCEYKQYCHVGNTAKQCRLGLFQVSDFAGDLEDSKSNSGGTLCTVGGHTFVPISWMCKKQTAFSHSSTESEIISLDTGLRLDGLPALELWDLIVSVFGSVSQISDRTGRPVEVKRNQRSQGNINVMENIDSVRSNVQSSRQETLFYVFEDNEAVIKMIIKGRSPTMRHVSRTHRVALDWLFD